MQNYPLSKPNLRQKTICQRHLLHPNTQKQITPSADESIICACDARSISGERRITQMQINEGIADRIARAYIGDALLITAVLGPLPSVVNGVLGLVGAVLVITGMAGRCPLYKRLGIDTTKPKLAFTH
jgi:hypothetical protein